MDIIPESNYILDASANTITLTGVYSRIDIGRIVSIYDLDTYDMVYDVDTRPNTITISDGVITYSVDDTNIQNDTDKLKIVVNRLHVDSKDYLTRLAEDKTLGVTQIAKFAYNSKIGIGAPKILSNDLDIVHPNGIQVSFVSDDAGDDIDDTVGIRKLLFQYWDSNWVLQTEIIEMQGLTEVNSIGTDIYRIEEIRSISTGTSNGAMGDITISNVPADATIYAKVSQYRSTFERCLHYVAPGAIGVLKSVQASSATSGGVTFIAINDVDFSDIGGGARVPSGVAELELSNGNATYVDLNPPLVIDNTNGTTGMALAIGVYATLTTNQDGAASMSLYEYTPQNDDLVR